jgi:hypothetical protein
MPPQIEILPTEDMINTLQTGGHFITPDFPIYEKACKKSCTTGIKTVDFIRLYRTYTTEELRKDLHQAKHRLSTPAEALALAIAKHHGKIGDISYPIMVVDGIPDIRGLRFCLSLQMWNKKIRVTEVVLQHALKAGNFILTTQYNALPTN